MFWLIVLGVLAVVLVLAWRFDRRGTLGRRRTPPEDDRAVGDAKSETYRRNIEGLGPINGP